MKKPDKDEEREERIIMEVVVDAYDTEERAMGWYYYIAETIQFPFSAKCKSRRATSPLKIGDTVKVIEIAEASECQREIFVSIRWGDDTLAIPLSQIEIVEAEDDEAIQAIEDWHYWMEMGYEF